MDSSESVWTRRTSTKRLRRKVSSAYNWRRQHPTAWSKTFLQNGFWHIRLNGASSFLITFDTPFGRYRWKRMPFFMFCARDVSEENERSNWKPQRHWGHCRWFPCCWIWRQHGTSNRKIMTKFEHLNLKGDKAGKSKNERERERERERITDTRYGSENQSKKNELTRMGIEPMAFGLALRLSNHWAIEIPHLNHHIWLCYHPTVDNVVVAWLSGCSDPKLRMAVRVRYLRNTWPEKVKRDQWAFVYAGHSISGYAYGIASVPPPVLWCSFWKSHPLFFSLITGNG